MSLIKIRPNFKFIFVFTTFFISFFLILSYKNRSFKKKENNYISYEESLAIGKDVGNNKYFKLYTDLIEKFSSIKTRDFMRYDCKIRKRIGGEEMYLKNAPDSLYRIDGAWYLCFDSELGPIKNKCNVLSFGINTDYTFDKEMNTIYGCKVHSFDPFIEAELFKDIRNKNQKYFNSPVLAVQDNWFYYKIGITGDSTKEYNNNLQINDMLTLENILRLTNLLNNTIDIFKIDIEGNERSVFDNMDIDYACKYIKQLMFETHKNFKFYELAKFEKCFRLYHRDTRLYLEDILDSPTGTLGEFQNPKGYRLNLKLFKNEIDLSEYLFVNGEFYFINKNFL